MTKKKRLIRGIKAYKPQQDKIIKFITENNGRITSEQFDIRFMPWENEDVWGMAEDSFILRAMNPWLHLLLIMKVIGLVKRRIYKNPERIFWYNVPKPNK